MPISFNRYILAPFLFLLLLFPYWANAQPAPAPPEKSDTINIDSGQLEELIATLEDEGRRKAFIDNLKTLQKVHDEQEPAPGLKIVEMIGLEEAANTVFDSYESFVDRYQLNSSFLGKLGLTAGTLMITLVILMLLRYGRKRLHQFIEKMLQRHRLAHQRYYTQLRLLYGAALLGIGLFTFYTLLVIWGFASFDTLAEGAGRSFIATLLNIFLVLVLAFLLWEVCNGLIETTLRRADGNARRLQTLLPVARNALLLIFGVMFSLIILSEIGIEIGPLLAGAGIVGIAIGFGAQTLVKDFLSGFMVILEDLIRVGDVVNIAGHSGLVERITIRKVELRDLQGIVHTVPFSEITIIENLTKEFSFYILDVGVAYREDTDYVIELLNQVSESMLNDPKFAENMLEPLEVFGVDRFADSAVIIKGRLKTRPIKQWEVGREFNRRMKKLFDEKNIEIPFPHQTLYFGQDKDGKAPAANIRFMQENPAPESE